MQINDYAEWFAFSLGVGTVCASIATVFSYFCYREQWDDLVHIARTILKTGRETPKNTLAG